MWWSVTQWWRTRRRSQWPEQETLRDSGLEKGNALTCQHRTDTRNHKSVCIFPSTDPVTLCWFHRNVPSDLLRQQRGSFRKPHPVPISRLYLWTWAAKTVSLPNICSISTKFPSRNLSDTTSTDGWERKVLSVGDSTLQRQKGEKA